mgnify:CR=1 FL=1
MPHALRHPPRSVPPAPSSLPSRHAVGLLRMLSLRLLGQPGWQPRDGQLHPLTAQRRHQLLAVLGYERQWVARDRLSALFWPERPDRAARGNLRKVIHELRGLGLDSVEEGPQGLRWPVDSDVSAFTRAWEQGDWQRAADTGAGELMCGLDDTPGCAAFGEWLRAERERWHVRWRDAVLRAVACSDPPRAWALVEQLLDRDPLDEEAMALGLRAAAALQRPELALPAWQRFVERLRADQGREPPPALSALALGKPEPCGHALSTMVGRELERDELTRRLSEGRLVTLLGIGGVGKTRLARDAAHRLATRFTHGVVFVELEDASTPDEMPARVASALGLTVAGDGDTLQALLRALAGRVVLLVLDGFEAVIDAAPAVVRLLESAPGLRILTTSRERLAVDGEWVLPLAGLETPARDASDEEVRRTQSVVLFDNRARAVNPAFALNTVLGPVAEICRRLDGLPLALELVSSWVRLMPAAEIAGELVRGIDLLEQGGDVDLHAVFDRSWALLSARERDAQSALAVFHGGFTREAAVQVAGVDLRTLAALADKSMLVAHPSGRFSMHPLVLTHARRKLGARPEAAPLQLAHSRWFLARVDRPDTDMADEHDNLLAAWEAAVARQDAAALEAVLFKMPWASLVHGQIGRAAQLLQVAAQAFDAADPMAAQLQALQAWLLLWQGQRPRATALAAQALQALEGRPQVPGRVMALRTLGHAARLDGQHARAAEHLAEGMRQAQAAGLRAIQALMQDGLAMALNMLGRHDEARAAIEAASPINHEAGDAIQRVYNLYNLSQSHSLAGEPDQALPWARQALELAQRIGFAYFLPHAHVELALVHLALHQFDNSRRQLEASRRLASDHQDSVTLAATHEAAARLALAEGDRDRGWQHVGVAARLCLEHHHVATGASVLLTAARLLGTTPLAQAWLDALVTLPEVQEPVRRQALETRGTVPPAQRSAAALTLRQLLAQLIASPHP